MIDTTNLRELAQNAAPGPWTQWEGRGWVHAGTTEANAEGYMAGTHGQVCRTDCGDFSDAQEIKNAEYIASANPATVLALLDELDRLRKVESTTLQGEKIGCRCTYSDNQTVDTECLYHRAIRSERDRLRAELTAMREDLNDARSEFRKVAAGLNDAAQCIARQSQTISRLQDIEAAASNLAKVKGRHNSEIAMDRLLEALK